MTFAILDFGLAIANKLDAPVCNRACVVELSPIQQARIEAIFDRLPDFDLFEVGVLRI